MQNKYFSHKDHSLEDHSFETGKKSRNTVRKKDLNLSIIDKKTLEIIVFIQGLIHDFGKFMIYFQDYFLKNFNKELMKNFHLKDHSFISALVAYEVIKQYTKDEMLAMIVFNSIRKHHGNLESPLVDIANNRCQVNNLKKQFDSLVLEDIEKFYDKHLLKYGINIKDIVIGIKEKIEDDPYEYLEDLRFEFIALIDMYEKDKEDVAIERFLLFNFLYSVLIDTDKKDSAKITEEYFEGAVEKKISVKDFIKYMQEKHSEIYDPNKSINKLRDEFFNSVVDNKKIKK
ncbi:MAG: CRISPR-associated endonuclease Cas3'' [Candidatus Woesearchaeota archaeon]